jgi:hypothetical protein
VYVDRDAPLSGIEFAIANAAGLIAEMLAEDTDAAEGQIIQRRAWAEFDETHLILKLFNLSE